MNMIRTMAAVLLAAAGTGLCAQPATTSTVYRCGPDGKQYSATPCPGGTALPDDARSAEQRRAAEDVAARDRKLADQLTAERRAREKAIVPTAAANVGPAGAQAAAGASAPKKAQGQKKPKPPKTPKAPKPPRAKAAAPQR
jgi:hypothetical protein